METEEKVNENKEQEEKFNEDVQNKSKPAVEKVNKKEKEEKVELEREYVIPLRKEFLKAPKYRRAKKAVKTVKEFLAKHMKVENRDLNKVKVNIHLNNEIWFRGIKKPANKIKVKAIKKGGIVYAELAEVPEMISYKISREIKRAAKVKKVKMPKHPEKKEESTEEKKDEIEKEKASIESGLKEQKEEAKAEKHTTKAKGSKAENLPAKQRRATKK